ncbi:MAG TPA: copper amine oxidase N-terminal domain-containing protein [Candidatus Acidoferrum sp.]|nr:copper amine oxidase N-terminal domain-containing protein [Candidatus Acidoferrum sp.]
MSSSRLRGIVTLGVTIMLSANAVLPARAADGISVTVNGTSLSLNPPPIERNNRLFVPLRGVFENLGASVSYANNGQISGNGAGHQVFLNVGSRQAFVDGRSQMLETAPFLVGSSVYVPLRFVSEALGALVNYDRSKEVVAISGVQVAGAQSSPAPAPSASPAPSPSPAHTPPPTPPPLAASPSPQGSPQSQLHLGHELPSDGSSIRGDRPTVQASFEGGQADPNSVHVFLDGRDVSVTSYISTRGVTYTPQSPILGGQHEVRIEGTDLTGAAFDQRWHFTSGSAQANATTISEVVPAPNETVGRTFTVRGRTAPGASVTVQVGQTTRGSGFGQFLGGMLGVGGHATVQSTVIADQNGRFSAPIDINAPSGATLGIVITSTDPDSGTAANPIRYSVRVR